MLRFERGEENLGRGLNVLIVVRKPHAEIRTRRGESRPWPYSVISSIRVESSLFILFHSVKIALFISSELVACDFAYPRSITLLLKRRIQSLLNMTFRTCWHNITLPGFAKPRFLNLLRANPKPLFFADVAHSFSPKARGAEAQGSLKCSALRGTGNFVPWISPGSVPPGRGKILIYNYLKILSNNGLAVF